MHTQIHTLGKIKQKTSKHHNTISMTAFPVCPCRTLLSLLSQCLSPLILYLSSTELER